MLTTLVVLALDTLDEMLAADVSCYIDPGPMVDRHEAEKGLQVVGSIRRDGVRLRVTKDDEGTCDLFSLWRVPSPLDPGRLEVAFQLVRMFHRKVGAIAVATHRVDSVVVTADNLPDATRMVASCIRQEVADGRL